MNSNKSNNSSSEKSTQKNATEVKASPRAMALAVVTLFIGILLGAVGTGLFTLPQTEDTKERTADGDTAPDSRLRLSLNKQLGEHAELLTLMSLGLLDESETDKEPLTQALEENSNELADTVGSVYNEEHKREFLELWQSRNDHFIDYTISSKNDNEAGVEQARQDLSEDTEEIALLLVDAADLDQEELVDNFSEHEELFTGMVQARLEDDQERFYKLRGEASRHVAELADRLAAAFNER